MIIERADCGLAIEPENDAQLAEVVVRLAKEPDLAKQLGENGRQFVVENYDREKLAWMY